MADLRERLADILRSFHQNACYPDAADFEVEAAIDRILTATQGEREGWVDRLVFAARAVNAATFSHVDGRDLLAELHPRRSLDIKRRVDGVEKWFEGDWLSDLFREIKPLRAILAQLPVGDYETSIRGFLRDIAAGKHQFVEIDGVPHAVLVVPATGDSANTAAGHQPPEAK